jgi:hypothetical protein
MYKFLYKFAAHLKPCGGTLVAEHYKFVAVVTTPDCDDTIV